jgi:hypothetical protein
VIGGWRRPLPHFDVRRDGEPILDVPLRHSLNAGITFSRSFEDWEAGTSAGLNMWEWDSGKYPPHFVDKVVAWHRLHGVVEAHVQDAMNKETERKSRKH